MWTIGGKTIESRFFLGTARYPSPAIMREAIHASGSEVITVSLRRESARQHQNDRFWDYLKESAAHILPNTAGCHSVKEAVSTAHMARDLFGTNWIKLEVIGNEDTLQPDPFALVEAAKILCEDGFEVFPYSTEDLIVAERLVEAGCSIVMPWGSPIGSGQGIKHWEALKLMRHHLPETKLIVDAGIGKPSHAALAMELGFDGVLLNTAVALAGDPVSMAKGFSLAIAGGRMAFEAGMMAERSMAEPSTPNIGKPFWHEESYS